MHLISLAPGLYCGMQGKAVLQSSPPVVWQSGGKRMVKNRRRRYLLVILMLGTEIAGSVIKAASCLLLTTPLQLIKYQQTLFFCPAIFIASVCPQLTPRPAHFNSFNVSEFQSVN